MERRCFLLVNSLASARFPVLMVSMILLAQNASLLTLSCHHFVMHYTVIHGLQIKCPFGPLDFLRSWYNDSAGAECKPAYAVLHSLRDAYELDFCPP